MFAPTKTFRRWHRRVNKNLRRYAVASALAASAIPALVEARGHKIPKVAELPLVVTDEMQNFNKTKEARAMLDSLNANDDLEKVKGTMRVRSGRGKWRNRRYINRKGPLLVTSKSLGGWLPFRNIPGVDLCYVEAMNLLQLAPGGHLGRFIIWSESAFKALDALYGVNFKRATARNYKLPRPICANTDIQRLINSDEIQSAVRPRREPARKKPVRRNPLKNRQEMKKLNPYWKCMVTRVRHAAKQKALEQARKKK